MTLKNEKFANAFSVLGTGDLSLETIILIEELLYQLYGYKILQVLMKWDVKFSEQKVKPLTVKNH